MSFWTHTHMRHRDDALQFRVIYWSTLPIFLVSKLATRALPGRPSAGLSLFREAQAAAQTCGSLALMG